MPTECFHEGNIASCVETAAIFAKRLPGVWSTSVAVLYER